MLAPTPARLVDPHGLAGCLLVVVWWRGKRGGGCAWHSPKLVYEWGAVVGEQMAMEPMKVEDILEAWAAMAGAN